MPKGKEYYPDATASPGKAKFQGGSSKGKKATLNKAGRETPLIKSVGTPKDKGVNR
jgi:hypothetical protein